MLRAAIAVSPDDRRNPGEPSSIDGADSFQAELIRGSSADHPVYQCANYIGGAVKKNPAQVCEAYSIRRRREQIPLAWRPRQASGELVESVEGAGSSEAAWQLKRSNTRRRNVE